MTEDGSTLTHSASDQGPVGCHPSQSKQKTRSLTISNLFWRLECRHRAWRYRTKLATDEIAWMRSVLRPGGVTVDAGAYKGGYTYWMREEVGPEGAVFAFEPQPELAAFLRRAVSAFSWTNVHIEEAGLSSNRGERILHAPPGAPSQEASLIGALAGTDARHYGVRTETLDAFVDNRRSDGPIDFIKCDVEGHELDMFRGAEAVLTRDRPLLLFECEARHNPDRLVSEVFDYVENLGYRGSFFWHGALVDVSEFDLETHQTLGRAPYANNFVFEPR